jgi:uncharacterized membrane protein (UPF0127 family)
MRKYIQTYCAFFFLVAFNYIPHSAEAVNGSLVYAREVITISPPVTVKSVAPEPASEAESSGNEEEQPVEDKEGTEEEENASTKAASQLEGNKQFEFDTEIKNLSALGQQWFMSLKSLPDDQALMLALEQPQSLILPSAQFFQPVDILVVDSDGIVQAILPSVTLANMKRQVSLDIPVKALIFLRGGLSDQLGISPQSVVDHRIFDTALQILQ